MKAVYDTIIIGGGQAGLAVGYHLSQQDRDFVILEAHEQMAIHGGGAGTLCSCSPLRSSPACRECLFQTKLCITQRRTRWPITWRPMPSGSTCR